MRQLALRVAQLCVLSVALLCILCGGQPRIKLYRQLGGRVDRIIGDDGAARSVFDSPYIRGDEVSARAVFLSALAFGKLLALTRDLLFELAAHASEQMDYISLARPQALCAVAFSVVALEHCGCAVIAVGRIAVAVQ